MLETKYGKRYESRERMHRTWYTPRPRVHRLRIQRQRRSARRVRITRSRQLLRREQTRRREYHTPLLLSGSHHQNGVGVRRYVRYEPVEHRTLGKEKSGREKTDP